MEDLESRLGDFVRAARQHADMSQRELAKASRVSRSTIVDLETGELLNPRLFTLLRIGGVAQWRVVFVSADGRPVVPYRSGIAVDDAGRELPAHLGAYARPAPNYWWERRGGYTFDRDRASRDARRDDANPVNATRIG